MAVPKFEDFLYPFILQLKEYTAEPTPLCYFVKATEEINDNAR